MFALLPVLVGGLRKHIRGGELAPSSTCLLCGEECSDGNDDRSIEEKKVRPYYQDCVYTHWDINGTTHWNTYHRGSGGAGECGGLQAWFNEGKCDDPVSKVDLTDWVRLVPGMLCPEGEPGSVSTLEHSFATSATEEGAMPPPSAAQIDRRYRQRVEAAQRRGEVPPSRDQVESDMIAQARQPRDPVFAREYVQAEGDIPGIGFTEAPWIEEEAPLSAQAEEEEDENNCTRCGIGERAILCEVCNEHFCDNECFREHVTESFQLVNGYMLANSHIERYYDLMVQREGGDIRCGTESCGNGVLSVECPVCLLRFCSESCLNAHLGQGQNATSPSICPGYSCDRYSGLGHTACCRYRMRYSGSPADSAGCCVEHTTRHIPCPEGCTVEDSITGDQRRARFCSDEHLTSHLQHCPIRLRRENQRRRDRDGGNEETVRRNRQRVMAFPPSTGELASASASASAPASPTLLAPASPLPSLVDDEYPPQPTRYIIVPPSPPEDDHIIIDDDIDPDQQEEKNPVEQEEKSP